jgi:uracil-DNA glycosylase
MENRADAKLMGEMLFCRKCKEQDDLAKLLPNDCLPVCCFGDPIGKKIFVVGINPSKAEYDSGFLEKDIGKALESQLKYFDRREYRYFDELKRFFDEDLIRTKLGITRNLWDKVGYLDLVKCVTIANKTEQWNGLKTSEKKKIVDNCQCFLEQQLNFYQPKLIVAYGKDVGVWFGGGKDLSYEEEFSFILNPRRLGFRYQVIYVPQRQGKHSWPEVNEIRTKIKESLGDAP